MDAEGIMGMVPPITHLHSEYLAIHTGASFKLNSTWSYGITSLRDRVEDTLNFVHRLLDLPGGGLLVLA